MGRPVILARFRHRLDNWLRAKIEKLLAPQTAEIIRAQEHRARLAEQRIQLATAEAVAIADSLAGTRQRRVEERAQLATAQAISFAESLARAAQHDMEARAQSAVDEAVAIATARSDKTARRLVEERSRLAANDAKGYMDTALGGLTKSIAAANRIVVRTEKRMLSTESDHLRRFENLEKDIVLLREDYNAQLRNAEKRIEFVRTEVLYEMQAMLAISQRHAPSGADLPRIVDEARVDAMRATGLRVNLGCGHVILNEYINVDGRELPGVDVIAEVTNLPFQEGELLEIHSAHLVEHFSVHILERVLLPYWHSLLKPGGILTTIAPDGAAMLQAVNRGEMSFDDFREVLFGGQEYDGDYHYNLIAPENWVEAVKRAGFTEIKEEYTGKRNGKCYEFKILAKKS